jgi:HSF-type DNA-binding
MVLHLRPSCFCSRCLWATNTTVPVYAFVYRLTTSHFVLEAKPFEKHALPEVSGNELDESKVAKHSPSRKTSEDMDDDAKPAAFDTKETTKEVAPNPPGAEPIAQTFPQRLMEMLENEVAPDSMWWTEDGKAFAMDLKKFGDVLHHHFQATKYASFTRKLNKWYVRVCSK